MATMPVESPERANAGAPTIRMLRERSVVEIGDNPDEPRIGGRAFDAVIVPNASVDSPAIDQFVHSYSPFARPAAEGNNPTGSNSGR